MFSRVSTFLWSDSKNVWWEKISTHIFLLHYISYCKYFAHIWQYSICSVFRCWNISNAVYFICSTVELGSICDALERAKQHQISREHLANHILAHHVFFSAPRTWMIRVFYFSTVMYCSGVKWAERGWQTTLFPLCVPKPNISFTNLTQIIHSSILCQKKGKNQRHRHIKSSPRKSKASNSWRSLLKSFNLNCPSFRFGVKSLVKSSPCVCSYKVDTAVNGVYPMEATFPPWHRNTLMLALLSNMSRPGRKANWGNWENIKEEKQKTRNRPLHILATARNNTKANNSCLVLWCNHTSN